MLRKLVCLSVLAIAASAPAAAQDSASHSSVKLTLNLGLVNAAGNTRVTSFNFGNTLEYKADGWKFIETTNEIYSRTEDSTTADQLKVGGRIDHTLFLVVHGFVGGTYERNKFAGIDHRIQGYAGLGIVLLDLPTDALGFDFGAVRSTQTLAAGLPSVDFTSVRLAANYKHNFNKMAYISEVGEVLPPATSGAPTLINSETQLVAPLSDSFALRIGYVVKYNSQPGFRIDGTPFDTTDRLLSSGVQISF